MPARAAAVALALLACLGSCRREPPKPVLSPRPAPEWEAWTPEARDLLALPVEPVATEWSFAVEPGDPASFESAGSGFSLPEAGAGRSFVWSSGDRSLVRFRLDEGPRPLELAIRGRPLEYANAPPQRIAVALNGRALGALELATGMREYRLPIPLAAQRTGWNALALSYARATPPADVIPGSGDRRRLGVAYESIRIAERGPSLEPVEVGGGSGSAPRPGLLQREPGALSHVLWLPAEARLDLAWVAPPQGASPVALRVDLEHDGGSEALLRAAVSPDGAPGERSLDLGRFGGRAVRLRFALEGVAEGALWLWTALAIDAPEPIAKRGAEATPARPSVALLVLDASARSRFGAYGSERGTTPHIDSLAQEGLVFDRAHSHAPYTLASTASLFTSRTPAEHGVVHKTDRLGAELPTLAELLRDAGYTTAAFSGNIFVARSYGMDRGFEVFEELFRGRTGGSVALASDFDAPVERWLQAVAPAARDGSRPFFLYVHFVQPHEPYNAAPPGFYRDLDPGYEGPVDGAVGSMYRIFEGTLRPDERDLARLHRLYEGNLRFADAAVGRLVEALRAQQLLERTLVIVTSDHGEALGERGLYGHNASVDESMTAIPLVVRLPGATAQRGRVDLPVGSIDLAPMILEAAGLEPAPSLAGRNPLRSGAAEEPARLLGARSAGAQPELAFWLDGFKYVRGPGSGPRLLTGSDPDAAADAGAEHPVTLDLFEAARRAWQARAAGVRSAKVGVLSQEERDSLRALGYLPE